MQQDSQTAAKLPLEHKTPPALCHMLLILQQEQISGSHLGGGTEALNGSIQLKGDLRPIHALLLSDSGFLLIKGLENPRKREDTYLSIARIGVKHV